MFSACDLSHRLSFFVNSGLNHFGADENNSFVVFESNWFTGIHFFVAFKRPDGSTNVLLNQNDDFSFNTATISGKVFSEPNGLPPFEPLLKVSNLYKDNLRQYHLNISDKKENNPLQTLLRRLQWGMDKDGGGQKSSKNPRNSFGNTGFGLAKELC